jgi:polyisoprenoid-binding protein YceI
MRLSRLILAVVAALVIVAAIAAVAFFVRSGSGEASQPITAPTLDLSSPSTAEATAPPAEATAEAAAEPAAAPVVFALVPGDSSVSFELDEDMRGQRVTVVGTTPDVAGQIAVNFAQPSASQVGEIRFNLRTLATDNDFRNRALRGEILQSSQDAFEFGSFTPTAISGLSDTPVEAGQPVTFEVTGDLMLRDVSNPVTFTVVLNEVSPEGLTGEATATVNRNDWGLTIPDVPGIANVEEMVDLKIVIVAAPDTSAGAAVEATAEATAAPTDAASEPAAPAVYSINSGDSSVSFELDEDLRGQRVTVVGTTPDVAGQIAVNFAQPSASQVGEIRFNLRTLATDNDFRNRAIRGEILQSAQDEFEFGSFTPTAVSGLPDAPIEAGQPVTFQITGDLTLKGISNPVTFDVTLTEVGDERLVGQATATVNRNDWGLTIPSVPGVANVEEEVVLTINLVASREQ